MATAWWSCELPGYRDETKGTYTRYDYAALPPIPPGLARDFQWLKSLPKARVSSEKAEDFEMWRVNVGNRMSEARALGLTLPESFVRFMNESLMDHIEGFPAGAWFAVEHAIEPCPQRDGYLLLFMRDSQDVLRWYLYLDPRGDYCVVVGEDEFNLQYCGDSFEEFVYRTWIEAETWFAGFEGRALNAEQLAYCEHYRAPGDLSDRRQRCEVHGRLIEPGIELYIRLKREWIADVAFLKWDNQERFPYAMIKFSGGGEESVEVSNKRGVCTECREQLVESAVSFGMNEAAQFIRTAVSGKGVSHEGPF